MIIWLWLAISDFRRCRDGNAAVEFAILLPILLLLISATVDLGLGFQEKVRVQSALNSGLQHVMQTQGDNIATTRNVILHGLGPDTNATVQASILCRCKGTAKSCTASCSTGLDKFALASVSLPHKTILFDRDMSLEAHFELYVGQAK